MTAIHTALLPLALLLACGDKEDSRLVVDDDGDGYELGEDCNDLEASIHPDAVEYCDGVDQDCDGFIDDNPTDGTWWYADVDGDGFGDADDADKECEKPKDMVADDTDCDDRDETIWPGAPETCDEDDDDCDEAVDEDPVDAPTWYPDLDGDGFGDPAAPFEACIQPKGHVADATDCDDANDERYPDAAETCNDLDDDCDEDVDDDTIDGTTWYTDADGDGFGEDGTAVILCDPPGDGVTTAGDCDDADETVYPAAPEICGDTQINACEGSPDLAALECGGWGDPVRPEDALASASPGGGFGASLGSTGPRARPAALLVGAPQGGTDREGEVWWIPFPTGAGDLEADAEVLRGGGAGREIGAEVLGLPDLDGDGEEDFALAGTDEGDLGQGFVVVLEAGASDLDLDARAWWSGETEGELAGAEALALGGDLDGDGAVDLLIGARNGSLGGDLAGQAYLVPAEQTGARDLADAPSRLYATTPYGLAFARVLAPGDMDGDGVGDLLAEGTGDLVWLVQGPVARGDLDVEADADLRITDAEARDLSDLAAADLDGDGHRDLALSTGADSSAATYGGAAWILAGPWEADRDLSDARLSVFGTEENTFLGGELALVEDLDGDEEADLVLGSGSSTAREGSLSLLGGTRHVFLFSDVGHQSGSLNQADASLRFDGDDAGFGMDLHGPGDVDGDGRDDLLIAAPDLGSAWLYITDIAW